MVKNKVARFNGLPCSYNPAVKKNKRDTFVLSLTIAVRFAKNNDVEELYSWTAKSIKQRH